MTLERQPRRTHRARSGAGIRFLTAEPLGVHVGAADEARFDPTGFDAAGNAIVLLNCSATTPKTHVGGRTNCPRDRYPHRVVRHRLFAAHEHGGHTFALTGSAVPIRIPEHHETD
ncbi:hypothetical protein [Streptomyces flaveolus]|uniref:hypothetical protein n=1 Tax=Streptomyces flaveolus TaxID=67297 RepID=UPI0033E18721